MAENSLLEILVVDDDLEVISQLRELLPQDVSGNQVRYEFCGGFEQALQLLRLRRFDLLVTDIYVGRNPKEKNIHSGHIMARELVQQVRATRMCPIVLFTDGQVPPDLVRPPFVWASDKGGGAFEQLTGRIREALATGLPAIARRLHDDLDRLAGSYVWGFLESHWTTLAESQGVDTNTLERIIRRRAAIQLSRLDERADQPLERQHADPVDYYIYPPIVSEIRLGELIREKQSGQFRVVLTPHCFLVTQPGATSCRATHVLTAKLIPVSSLNVEWKWQPGEKAQEDLRRRTQFPASKAGQPDGRYCFLPGLLAIPDSYCDLFQLESLPHDSISNLYERVAVLDLPYAEALQSAMARLYGSVGLPLLNIDLMKHLLPQRQAKF
jgi:CheY-like chemotaxis protein